MSATPAKHRIVELTVDECMALLATRSLGRLVYVVDGTAHIRPLNYIVHQGSVTFRIGYGELLDVIHQRPVLFEVDHDDAETRTGWSVIVNGIAEEIWRADELSIVHETELRPWAPGNKDHYLRVLPTAITGRRID
jgi:nitroimidazol reductase NimA-like FMN-containing flavoprotein (pyridoxamine 5'-phosphate oxidase superfamily)